MLLNYFMVENSGIEPLTSCVQSRRSPSWAKPPKFKLMGLNGLEPSTSRLSGVRSNQLSYRPLLNFILIWMFWTLKTKRIINVFLILRKEVIQPHLPIRLPCYDFTPIIYPTLGGWLQMVTSPTSGVTNSRGVTGGVYKARERIHRGVLIRDY